MKIFFDGTIFGQQKKGGISRVSFELIRALDLKKDINKIFYRGLHIDDYFFEKKWFFKYYGFKLPIFLKGRFINLLNNLGIELSYRLNADKNLIFHSLYYYVPKKPKGPVLVHCHDMIHELFGNNTKAINFKKNAFLKADSIITISQSTKKDLCKIYSEINPEKVVVCHLGVSDIFLNQKNLFKNNGRSYMLYVGARGGYKNFIFLLDVFIEQKYFLDFDLVLVGGEKDLTLDQKEKIKKTQGKGNWLLHKFCNDQELARLYSNASVFIYPSLYEGFGIPPLEAMASGCPVIASNTSSIPESVGDAGLLFNPEDKQDFINKLESILKNKELAQELIKKGKERAKKFTWDIMTDIIYQSYKKLLS